MYPKQTVFLEENLAEVLNETWKKYKLDDRLKETQDEINSEILKLEQESKEINQMLEDCQRVTDKLRSDLYATFEHRKVEIPSLLIYETPEFTYMGPDTENAIPAAVINQSRLSAKRKLLTNNEVPAKRPAIPLGYTPLESSKPKVQENKADDDKDISVVKLSAESAPADLPPPGELSRPPLRVGMAVYAMKNAFGPWFKGKVIEITPKNGTAIPFTMCRIKFDHKLKNNGKILPARCIAYAEPAEVRMTIGTRLIALFKDANKRESYYSGVVAEIPNPVNNYRYLVFFDDGYAQYVSHAHTRLVCECSNLVWEEVHPLSREFVREYLMAYPERPMVRLHEGQHLKTEWDGKWWSSRVARVDASLAQVVFLGDGRREWVYRGSTRLAPLYLELRAAERHRPRPMPRSTQPRGGGGTWGPGAALPGAARRRAPPPAPHAAQHAAAGEWLVCYIGGGTWGPGAALPGAARRRAPPPAPHAAQHAAAGEWLVCYIGGGGGPGDLAPLYLELRAAERHRPRPMPRSTQPRGGGDLGTWRRSTWSCAPPSATARAPCRAARSRGGGGTWGPGAALPGAARRRAPPPAPHAAQHAAAGEWLVCYIGGGGPGDLAPLYLELRAAERHRPRPMPRSTQPRGGGTWGPGAALPGAARRRAPPPAPHAAQHAAAGEWLVCYIGGGTWGPGAALPGAARRRAPPPAPHAAQHAAAGEWLGGGTWGPGAALPGAARRRAPPPAPHAAQHAAAGEWLVCYIGGGGPGDLAPLYLELRAAERHRPRPMPRSTQPRSNLLPYVEYTRSVEQPTNKAQETQPVPVALTTQQQTEEIRRQRAVAKKSTTTAALPAASIGPTPFGPPLSGSGPGGSTAPLDSDNSRVVYYTPKNAVRPYKLVPHTCSPACKRSDVLSLKELRTYNPLAKPLLSGWERQIVRYKGQREVMYRAPCGRRLRSMRELHRYLRATDSELPVDLFDFYHATHCLAEFVLHKCLVGKKDLSHGKENVPVPCVNCYDESLPEFCSYNTERTPTSGVPLNLDPDFLCGCDCTDDCEDKTKCACWKMTLEGARTIGLEGINVGYEYKRLPEPLPSGIYECNSRCKCKQTCLNRVAQHPLQLKLQVFKTLNRGWGIRALNDVPKGAFLCVYAGNLLTDATANLDGLNEGDEYLAELDYIEVVEQMKEGYEEDIPDADKKLDKKDSIKPEDSEEEPPSSSEDDENASKTDKEDDDFKPGYVALGVSDFSKSLRKRCKIKKETGAKEEEEKEKESKGGDPEEDCITISDDDEVREPSRFTANPGMAGNDFVSKYRSVRTLFGEDEACYIMDAKVQGNIGRYLNHSCSPNVFVQNVFVDTHDPRFPWVAFFALSHVRAGTELTWNYNYDVGSVPGKILYCYCEAPNCRGRLL
ncbi:unnamed protein product [Arctia plantaginis]|uniref:Histone-lysine N-methyltransferase SETDB1 n=1 Tax=Arctia plantaginis TaxID=874455 RepID=A0A8S1BFZ5_ARCPL|nr:unnamed protein product [Arctia plantaginis]